MPLPFRRRTPALILLALATLQGSAHAAPTGVDATASANPAMPAMVAPATDQPFSFARTPGRLPKTVVPTDYTLRIRPDIENKTLAGTVDIRLRIGKATSAIVLNALNLEIQSASVLQAGTRTVLVPTLDKTTQTLTLTAPHALLSAGDATLTIAYTGVINAQSEGLFYDRYPTRSGEKVMLGTQMESTDARRMLPCWDEPVFRATFQMSVELPSRLKVFSNTPVAKTERVAATGQGPKSLTRTTFGRTPPMASYLLVLVAGELERISDTQDGTELGVVFTEGKRDSATFALASAKKILHYYNDYFGVKFPLPKLDSFAIPGGFSGAMENWGGITYNEAILLYDPKTSNPARKRGIFDVMAHEMAHQWFGDLVTTAWWDDLWLNEGFASWMDGKATEHFNPDWDYALDTGAQRERAMTLDARSTTHPIQQPIATESDAADAFDDITYQKGQAFLRMLENWLGEDTFRAGIRSYMEAHAYSSATTGDLWTSLAEASGKPVATFASAWTHRSGFPLVNVETICAPGNGTDGSVYFEQHRFRADPETVTEPLVWPIPLTLEGPGLTTTTTSGQLFMTGPNATVPTSDCQALVIADPEAKGYFRMAYAPKDRARMVEAFPSLPATARQKLLQDTWAQAAAGETPLVVYLRLAESLGNEPKRAIWSQVTGRYLFLDQLIGKNALRPAFRSMAIAALKPKFTSLGWDPGPGEDEAISILRANLISTLGDLDDPSVVAEARAHFQKFLADPKSLSPTTADAVMNVVGRHADAKTYEALLNLGQKALTFEEKQRYYFAAFSVEDDQLAARALSLSLDPATPELIANSTVASVAGDGQHLDMAWTFAKAHGDALLARSPSFGRNNYLGRIVATSTDPAIADDLVTYAGAHLPADALTESRRAADAIRVRARLRVRLMPQLESALAPGGMGAMPKP